MEEKNIKREEINIAIEGLAKYRIWLEDKIKEFSGYIERAETRRNKVFALVTGRTERTERRAYEDCDNKFYESLPDNIRNQVQIRVKQLRGEMSQEDK